MELNQIEYKNLNNLHKLNCIVKSKERGKVGP